MNNNLSFSSKENYFAHLTFRNGGCVCVCGGGGGGGAVDKLEQPDIYWK
jgi:hypothetical protein